ACVPVRYPQAPRKTRRSPSRHAHTLQRSLVFIQPSPRRRSTQPSPHGFALRLPPAPLRDQLGPRLATARGRPSVRTAGRVSARTSGALLEFLAERVPDL